ncbi:MAG: hypothetical protein OEQ13_06125 [Acidobacteriota bacterium]|nr:hypothetical protein [Acidobacteriota bacterium]
MAVFRPAVVILAAVACTLESGAIPSVGSPGSTPDLPLGEIASVEVTMQDRRDPESFETVSSTDAGEIEALAAVVRRAEISEDHKCRNEGTILFRMRDGGVVELGMLAGHEEGYYQYRYYDSGEGYEVFRVDRNALFDALETLGVRMPDEDESDQG